MTTAYPYTLANARAPRLGLIVLQSDLTLEDDLRRLLPASVSLLVSRVRSAPTVSSETLAEMAPRLAEAAGLFPRDMTFDAVGYGCTSATAEIGAAEVAASIRAGVAAHLVTEPVTALQATCGALALRRVAFLSPYVASVSARLRAALAAGGIETPVFGSFEEAEEARVAQIDSRSIHDAAMDLMRGAEVDALFLSCTNLRTLEVIEPLQQEIGVPVLSSNLVLAWHMLQSTGATSATTTPGDLLR